MTHVCFKYKHLVWTKQCIFCIPEIRAWLYILKHVFDVCTCLKMFEHFFLDLTLSAIIMMILFQLYSRTPNICVPVIPYRERKLVL